MTDSDTILSICLLVVKLGAGDGRRSYSVSWVTV